MELDLSLSATIAISAPCSFGEIRALENHLFLFAKPQVYNHLDLRMKQATHHQKKNEDLEFSPGSNNVFHSSYTLKTKMGLLNGHHMSIVKLTLLLYKKKFLFSTIKMGKEGLHPLVGHLVHFANDVQHNIGMIEF